MRGRPKRIPEGDLKIINEEAGGVAVAEEPVEKFKELPEDYVIQIIKDHDAQIDPFTLNKKDEKYQYRFLRDDQKNLRDKTHNLLYQRGGWQLCSREFLKNRLGMSDEEISPDGLCRRGDTVLAFMPKDLYLQKEEYKKNQAEAPVKQIERMIKKGDPENSELSGVGHENMKGLQTAKQLGLK